MIAFELEAFLQSLMRTVIYHETLERLVEHHHEPVPEVLRHSTAVLRGISHHCLELRYHLYV